MSAHLPVVIDSPRLAEALARFPRDRMTGFDWTSLGFAPSKITLRKEAPRPQTSAHELAAPAGRRGTHEIGGREPRPLETAPDRIRRERDELEG
jgi:hypothetical protein